MRFSIYLIASSIVGATLALLGNEAHAQAAPNNKSFIIKSLSNSDRSRTVSPVPILGGGTILFTGHVISPKGALPGAVVQIKGIKKVTVTDADGEFSLLIPRSKAPVSITASYAGFDDETVTVARDDRAATVELATPKTIKVARNQQLKAYLKTAHRQARRDLR